MVTKSRAHSESVNSKQAFYLAEGGLEAAKWEIGEAQDPDGDGVGNRCRQTSGYNNCQRNGQRDL